MPTLHVCVVRGEDLPPFDANGLSDPYVVLTFNGHQKKKTKIVYKSLAPVWGDEFSFAWGDEAVEEGDLGLEVWDKDTLRSEVMGRANVKIRKSMAEAEWLTDTEMVVDLMNDSYRRGRIVLSLKWDASGSEPTGGKKQGGMLGSLVSNVASVAQRALATAAGNLSGLKKTGVHRLVNVEVVEARGLPGVDRSGTSDPYAVVKLGGKSHRTRIRYKTCSPTWNAAFEFRVMDFGGTVEPLLKINVFDHDFAGHDTLLGFVHVDLTQLTVNVTDERYHRLQPPSETKRSMLSSAFAHLGKKVVFNEAAPPDMLLNITVQDLFLDLSAEEVRAMGSDVIGHAVIRVSRTEHLAYAKDDSRPTLSGGIPDADPFVTVRCGGFTGRTPSIARTYEPVWNHVVVVPIKDVFDSMLIRVLDDDVHGAYRSMGSLLIPCLGIRNAAPTWYTLKNDSLLQGVAGRIELAIDVQYNGVKAALKVIKPRSRNALDDAPDQFKSKVFKGHVERVRDMVFAPLPFLRAGVQATNWELGPGPAISMLVGWTLFWALIEVWHIPFGISLGLLGSGIARFRRRPREFYAAELFDGDGDDNADGEDTAAEEEEEENNGPDEDDKAADKPAKISSRGLFAVRAQVQQLTNIATVVQTMLGVVADTGERIKNLALWESPHLSALFMVGCAFASIICWLVPFRVLAILFGWNRIVRRGLRKYSTVYPQLARFKPKPHHRPVIEIWEFIGRVPTDLDLERRKRLPAHESSSSRDLGGRPSAASSVHKAKPE